ncbi:LysR family transcriptional regulator [Shewanella sp. OPT22]|nr:LysR family transcriptional regulator [Shewanella sp. OPT22]
MDVKLLKTFVAVAENKHFGKAAEQVFLTQAAVSARIKQLEEAYKTQLLIRDKNNLKLTAAGEALLLHSYILIDQFEASKSAVSMASKQKLSFQIAATPNIWDAYFQTKLIDVTNLFKENVVSTEISTRESIQRKLDDKSLNVGFLADPIKDDEFINIEIGRFEIALTGTKPEFDPLTDNYVYVDWGIKFIKENTFAYKLTPSFKTSTASIALEWVLSQGGFAYLPVNSVQNLLENQQLFTITSQEKLTRPIYMVYKKNASQRECVETLTLCLTSHEHER